jgi:hypothetical protein
LRAPGPRGVPFLGLLPALRRDPIAVLAQRYRYQLVPGLPVEPWPLITLRPRQGIRMQVEPRAARAPAAQSAS